MQSTSLNKKLSYYLLEQKNTATAQKLSFFNERIWRSPEFPDLFPWDFTGTYLKMDPSCKIETHIFPQRASGEGPSLGFNEEDIPEKTRWLITMGVPSRYEEHISHLFKIIFRYQELLLATSACYSGAFYTTHFGSTKDITRFKLETNTQIQEITLVFNNLNETKLLSGLNIIRRAFGLLSMQRYIHRTPNRAILKTSRLREEVVKNENIFLPLIQGDPRFVKIFSMVQYGRCDPDSEDFDPYHVTLMAEYDRDLLDFILSCSERKIVLPDQVKIELAIKVVRCVAGLKQHHIVHRDIKPDNILLGNGISKCQTDPFSSTEAAVRYIQSTSCAITDFGHALPARGHDRAIWGTPDYIDMALIHGLKLSKEQQNALNMEWKISLKSFNIFQRWELWNVNKTYKMDMFSLGVVLYTIFSNGNYPQWISPNEPETSFYLTVWENFFYFLAKQESTLARLFHALFHPDPDQRPDYQRIIKMLESLDCCREKTLSNEILEWIALFQEDEN